jgi:hypothetical protein
MVNFNFSFAPGTSLQQMVGFETAGRVWASYLTDNITVNLHVGVSSDLPSNVIGGALPGIRASQSYREVVQGLQRDQTSADDVIAVNNLSDKSDYEAWFDEFDRKNGKNAGEKGKTKEISLTRANAKAIGLLSGASDLDGVIVFGGLSGSSFRWNYDFTRSNSAPTNTLDFLSTAMHEIAHILGFVSGIDKPGWLNSAAPDKQGIEEYKRSLQTRITYTTPLDLFRFSGAAGTNINDLSYGSIGSDKVFSIDGGKTAIAQFSTGLDRSLGGDGFQASHWKNGAITTGIMAPTLSPQEQAWILTADLRAMDVMGWNLRGATVDLSTLRSQAEQSLAQRLGVDVSWLAQNSETAAQQLGRDRSADIDTMIRNSEVYGWGTRPPGGGTPLPNPWRQVLGLFEQRAVYSSFSTLDSEFPPVENASGSQTSGVSSLLEALKIPAILNPSRFEITPNPNAVTPGIAPIALSLEKLGNLSGRIASGHDVQKWLDRGLRLVTRQQGNFAQAAPWEALEWSDL